MKTKLNMKRTVIEMIVYGFIVVLSSALFHLNHSTLPATYHAKGKVQFALIQVPVPIDPGMEGRYYEYVVKCGMKKGVVECQND